MWCVAPETHVQQSCEGGCPGMVGVTPPETHERQSWDGGSYCGVWPLRPMCGSPGMVGVTVVCGP